MSENNRDTLRRVAWSEICPWLVIFRTFRVAIGLRILVLAAVAVVLTLAGWDGLGRVFRLDDKRTPVWMTPPWAAVDEAVPDAPSLPRMEDFTNVTRATTDGRVTPSSASRALMSGPALTSAS